MSNKDVTSNFDQLAVVGAPCIYRLAKVSAARGDVALAELKGEGLLQPTVTKTGRKFLTVSEARALYEKLTRG